jgi:hypothetical protein
MTPEGKVKAKVKKALAELGRHQWRFMPVQTGYGADALDFLICVNGYFVAIETKAAKGKLTPRQETTAEQITSAGGRVFVVRDDKSLRRSMHLIKKLLRR